MVKPRLQLPSLKQCITGKVHLAYRRTGKSKPVVLLHGITTHSFILRRIIPLLESYYDVIAIDMLECGGSDKSIQEDYSIKHQAELLRAFVTEFGSPKVHLVGHDFSRRVAQNI